MGSTPKRRNDTTQKNDKKNMEIWGIILFLFGFFMGITLLGYETGLIGSLVQDATRVLFGMVSPLVSLYLMIEGSLYMLTERGLSLHRRGFLVLLLGWFLLILYHHVMVLPGEELDVYALMHHGGILGGVPAWFIHLLLGSIGTVIFLVGLSLVDVLLITRWSLSRQAKKIGRKTEEKIEVVKNKIENTRQAYRERQDDSKGYNLKDFIFKKKCKSDIKTNEVLEEENDKEIYTSEPYYGDAAPESIKNVTETLTTSDVFVTHSSSEIASVEEEQETVSEEPTEIEEAEPTTSDEEKNMKKDGIEPPGYQFPPLSLLHEGGGEKADTDADEKAHRLEATLRSFGVNAIIRHVSVGPSVTRYELEPAPGVRVSKIEGLADDIALQLAATSIRIEAPIPGKSAVGIEIPNSHKAAVPLYDVLSSEKFKNGKGKILVALGKDIAGQTVVADLAQMPHLLIAGQTGSGKSVCINTLITSILYHSHPDEVKLILIDPKVVELSVYNGIPHLRIEVVTHPKKAAGALNWAVREMENRYQSFSECNVRDIGGFNKQNPDTKMSYIVVIIDELADLMMVAKDSVEDSICRLAQKARAAGIHLVVATQRPSVDVITGLIKANIPSRISFAVSSQVDSRTILDKAGAEKLLGKGDMLFDPSGSPNPIRVQGAFISDEEVEAVVNYLKNEAATQEIAPKEEDDIDLSLPEENENAPSVAETDELLEEAAEWMLDTKRASVSALQRRFRIGYTRAGRLIDSMESLGIVGPAEGSKPRNILITKEQLFDLFHQSPGSDSE